MTAPSCPVSSSQLPAYRLLFRGNQSGSTTSLGIPIATDLASLIRAINAIRDSLQGLTTSRTVNNLYLPRDPNYSKKGDKYYSSFPMWDEMSMDTSIGIVTGKKDKTSQALVQRQNQIYFENKTQNDPSFIWSYDKPIK